MPQLKLGSTFLTQYTQYLMSRPRKTPADIIDVDALPERNRSRRPGRRTVPMPPFRRTRTTATIDLTNVDSDSDSNISILTSTPKPGAGGGTPVPSKGKGREMDFPSTIGPAIDKIRVCSLKKWFHSTCYFSYSLQKRRRTTPNSSNSQSHPHISVPPTKKMKRSSPSPASRERPTSSNNHEPIASTSGSSTLSLSDISLELSKGTLSQAELAKIAQEMLSQLHQTVPSSSRPMMTRTSSAIRSNVRTKDKEKRTFACIELSSDGEEVDKKRQKHTAAFLSSNEPIAGPSSAIDFEGAVMDLPSDIDVESDEESNYDHIHAGYDIHNPDIVRTLTIITVCLTYNET